jgi:hypothetical protein
MKVTTWIAGMLSAAVVLLWLGSATAALTISIEPALTQASVGDTVEIAVHADGAGWVGWYWVSIMTDEDVLTYLDCSTEILSGCPSGWNCMICGPTGEPGVFEADCACFGYQSCVAIPGDLVIVRYVATGDGVSPVSFDFAQASDCNRDMIPTEASIDGSVVVSCASVEPGDGYRDQFIGTFVGFPNPFRRDVTLRFGVPSPSGGAGGSARKGKISIFDCTGREVRAFGVTLSPGEHVITWDGSDREGASVPPGIYFCRYPARDGFGTYKITRLD